ncbi:MAG: class I SAM-dependent methyltransferase [Elusimicrobiota bacterium]
MLLRGPYSPPPAGSRMRSVRDLRSARRQFFKNASSNLRHLIESQYRWMKPYLAGKKTIVEIGGLGLASEYIRRDGLILAGFEKQPWIDVVVDPLHPPFADQSMDAILLSHSLHLIARPAAFFRQMRRILRPGGRLLIQDVHTSLLLRALLRLMRHDAWSYEVDVFDEEALSSDPRDPWAANCALPQLLFSDPKKFQHRVPGFRILKNRLCECLVYPLSGGVIAKFPTIDLPRPLLRLIDRLDRLLVALAPDVFAMGRRVALEKTPQS